MKKFYVVYSHGIFDHSEIVIWCDERKDVRKILKKHLGHDDFIVKTIKDVTERSVVS